MSAIGPDLPPHLLAKRKRKQEEAAQNGPAAASGANRPSSPGEVGKRRRVIGPAMPPAPLDERPEEPAQNTRESDSSDDDDDLGPALPSNDTHNTATNDDSDNDATTSPPPQPEKLRRDDWMTMPPKQDDLAARMDPTKIRARGFNTGKGAKGPSASSDDSSAWNETPEQKQKRLQDEMMGVARPSAAAAGPGMGAQKAGAKGKSKRDAEEDRRAREEIAKSRGASLMDKHSVQNKGKDVEDDPSKRAFDRDKDMSTGVKIGHSQRKDLLNKASGFSSKFSGGSYL